MKRITSYLKRIEQFCKDYKRTLCLASIITLVVGLFYYNLIFIAIYTVFWLGWGIGYDIPQNVYRTIKRKLAK